MGVQSNKVQKRSRRIRYIKRKKEAAKVKRAKPPAATPAPAPVPMPAPTP